MLCERQEYQKPDDVKVTDLNGAFVRLSDISQEDSELLAKVYHMADKANAHLTHGASFMEDASIVHAAIPVIDMLLRRNLYDRLGEKPRGHWDRPPTPDVAMATGGP